MSAVKRLTAAAIVIASLGALAPSSALAAAPTIDSYLVQGSGSTLADCDSVDVQHSDAPPDVSGSGAFTAGHTLAPPDSSASCADGSGTDQTAGNQSSTGAIDSGDVLRLSDTAQGSTTTNATFTGDPNNSGCVDVGDGLLARNTVQFTITQATPFSYSGTLSSTGQQANGHGTVSYSLTRTSAPSATIFDQTQGLSPKIKGTLDPGTYQYQVGGRASNDLACTTSGTETDSYSYDVRLIVGTVAPPVNTALPAISGTPAVGQTLTCSNGTWDNNPTSFAYQWSRDGAPLTGATGQTYIVQPGDQGHTLICTVTATNDGGDTPATSAGVAIPAPPAGLKPKCTVTSSGKVARHRGTKPSGTLPVTVKCDQNATIGLAAVLRDVRAARHRGPKPKPKRFQLAGVSARVLASQPDVLKLKLPPAAVRDLAHGAKESVNIALTATDVNGTSRTAARISPLRI